jgi:hypothetical protein
MTRDREHATKAAQTAALLQQDLNELVRSENLLLSDFAMRELEAVRAVKTRLELLQALLADDTVTA